MSERDLLNKWKISYSNTVPDLRKILPVMEEPVDSAAPFMSAWKLLLLILKNVEH